jgi:hypothetical protein
MTCCVPTFRARSFPSRIHLRMVSGFLPVRLAASGTVSIVVVYDDVRAPGMELRQDQGATQSGSEPHVILTALAVMALA